MIPLEQLQQAYQQACEIELQAFKPGNVSIYSAGHGMTVEDFKRSAIVSAAAITHPDYSLGEKIYYAIQATRTEVGCNTNLGIVLLCAPLLTAATVAVKNNCSLRQALEQVLATTTVDDANWVFKAISLASPAGLGESKQQDVKHPAQVTLTQAMAIAQQRDRIALQYVTGFKDIFDFAIIRYNEAFNCFFDYCWAALAVYVALLGRYPDSHIERKYGGQYHSWVSEQMTVIAQALTHLPRPELVALLYKIDADFKSKNINPGTTADMTVATVLVKFLDELLSANH
jgi:triphosphoribosyl-dephospho-CoA synthase